MFGAKCALGMGGAWCAKLLIQYTFLCVQQSDERLIGLSD